MSSDAKWVWGLLTEGVTVPRDLGLGIRPGALKQLEVQAAAHAQMVAMVKEVLPEREAGLLIGSRPWPLLAARMQQLGEHHGTDSVAQHLGRLTTGTLWQEATGPALVGRLVDATLTSLTTPPGTSAAARPGVSAVAVGRFRSPTTLAAAAPGRFRRRRRSRPTGSGLHWLGAWGVRGDGDGGQGSAGLVAARWRVLCWPWPAGGVRWSRA
ncbi:hypothetical protein ACWENO_37535 [Streptomyces sp. NPDC004436]